MSLTATVLLGRKASVRYTAPDDIDTLSNLFDFLNLYGYDDTFESICGVSFETARQNGVILGVSERIKVFGAMRALKLQPNNEVEKSISDLLFNRGEDLPKQDTGTSPA